jgi:hypothetical protein
MVITPCSNKVGIPESCEKMTFVMIVDPLGILPLTLLARDAAVMLGFEARRILAEGAIKT